MSYGFKKLSFSCLFFLLYFLFLQFQNRQDSLSDNFLRDKIPKVFNNEIIQNVDELRLQQGLIFFFSSQEWSVLPVSKRNEA